MFYGQNISIHINFEGGGFMVHGPSHIFRVLLKKTEKVEEHDLAILKSNSTSF